jgi:large subunit ribosomal protein L18
MPKEGTSRVRRYARHRRIRRRLRGVAERPRLTVFRSLRHTYAQIVDDSAGVTLVSASTLDQEVKSQRDSKPKVDVSRMVGELVAKRSVEKGVTRVVFDRGGYKYHGRVKALADAARKGGLKF